jgi:hypothetical protein
MSVSIDRSVGSSVTAAPLRLARGAYIASPAYDWAFFILAPLWAMLIGMAVRAFALDQHRFVREDDAGKLHQIALIALLSAAFRHAHLVIVLFRTHLNRSVFRRYPHRFVTTPIALFFAAVAFDWVFVTASVLTVWWDVYHSSLQTFGLGHIYDRRAGNDSEAGRSADHWFNLVIYAGPVLAGVIRRSRFC